MKVVTTTEVVMRIAVVVVITTTITITISLVLVKEDKLFKGIQEESV